MNAEQDSARIKPIDRNSKAIPVSLKVVSDVTSFEGNSLWKIFLEFSGVSCLGFDIILGWDIHQVVGTIDFRTNTLTFLSCENDMSISLSFSGSVVMSKRIVF